MKRILRTSHCLPAIRSWQHFTPHTATGVNCRFVWLPDHDMTVGRWDWLFCFSLSVSIWMKPGCLTMTVWTLIFPMVCFSDCLIPYPVSLSNDEMRRWSGDYWPRCKYIKHHLAVFILVSKNESCVFEREWRSDSDVWFHWAIRKYRLGWWQIQERWCGWMKNNDWNLLWFSGGGFLLGWQANTWRLIWKLL